MCSRPSVKSTDPQKLKKQLKRGSKRWHTIRYHTRLTRLAISEKKNITNHISTFKVVQLCNMIPTTSFLPIPQKNTNVNRIKNHPPTSSDRQQLPSRRKNTVPAVQQKDHMSVTSNASKPQTNIMGSSQNLQLQALCL